MKRMCDTNAGCICRSPNNVPLDYGPQSIIHDPSLSLSQEHADDGSRRKVVALSPPQANMYWLSHINKKAKFIDDIKGED